MAIARVSWLTTSFAGGRQFRKALALYLNVQAGNTSNRDDASPEILPCRRKIL
jgi:hypothetical protein